MISLKGPAEIDKLRLAGRLLAGVMKELLGVLRSGLATKFLDGLAREAIERVGARPSFLGYRPVGAKHPFPAALCVSLNDEVVHGLPGERLLAVGDLVSLDLGLERGGMFVDLAVTAPVGRINQEAERLRRVTAGALACGIAAIRPGGAVGDISAAIESFVRRRGFDLVREFGGHGVGFRVHEEPEVSNCGRPGTGARLEPGLVIAIEPMVTAGRAAIVIAPDGYTVKTKDGRLAAHFEHTVLVTPTGAEILTKL